MAGFHRDSRGYSRLHDARHCADDCLFCGRKPDLLGQDQAAGDQLLERLLPIRDSNDRRRSYRRTEYVGFMLIDRIERSDFMPTRSDETPGISI